MRETKPTLEEILSEKFISEFESSGNLADVLPILSLISVSHDGSLLCDESSIATKHKKFSLIFISILEKIGPSFSIPDFVNHGLAIYNKLVSSVDIYLSTDTLYSDELKNYIGNLCKDACGAEKYIIHEKVTNDHGGGFVARFREYYFDASYRQGILS